MKITETTQMEFNPEIEVKMTLKELSTIIAIIGGMSSNDMMKSIQLFKSFRTETVDMIQDIGTEDNTFNLWHSLINEIKSAPKKPKFKPFTIEVESMEELLALRIGTGRLTKSCIDDWSVKNNISDDPTSVFATNVDVHSKLCKQFSKSVE